MLKSKYGFRQYDELAKAGAIHIDHFIESYYYLLDRLKLEWDKENSNRKKDQLKAVLFPVKNYKRPLSDGTSRPFPIINERSMSIIHGCKGKKRSFPVNIKKLLLENPEVEKFLDFINSESTSDKTDAKENIGYTILKNLYQPFKEIKQELDKHQDTLEMPDRLSVSRRLSLNILFLYRGYFGYKDYVNNYRNNIASIDNTKDSYSNYYGFYYGLYSMNIKSFILSISNVYEESKGYLTKEIGFHNLNKNDDEYDAVFSGYSNFNKAYIRSNLGFKGNNPISLIGMGNLNSNVIKGIIQTVSYNNNIISAEVVLVKTEKIHSLFKKEYLSSNDRLTFLINIIGQAEYKSLLLYLMIKRNSFYVNNKVHKALDKLTFGGKFTISYTYLVGRYRIWNFNFKENTVVESMFKINQDGKAELFPFIPKVELDKDGNIAKLKKKKGYDDSHVLMRKNFREQNCFINITTANTLDEVKLWVVSFPSSAEKADYSVSNVALFDFPKPRKDSITIDKNRKKRIIDGTFSSIGYGPHGFWSDYVVMIELEEDEVDIVPNSYDNRAIKKYAKDLRLDKLLERLNNVWKDKNDKRFLKSKKHQKNIILRDHYKRKRLL